MPFDENLDEFLPEDGPGTVEAIYRCVATGALRPVFGNFEDQYAPVLGDAFEGSAPSIACKQSDVPHLAHGDEFTINRVLYVCKESKPDGTGFVHVRLEEQ